MDVHTCTRGMSIHRVPDNTQPGPSPRRASPTLHCGRSPARQPPSKLAQGSWQAHAVYGASQVTRLVVQNKVAMSVAEAATTIG
jgi:hypothetical protein